MISLERRDGRPLRIGHRGAAALAPENTLRSFRAAVDAGVDLVEFDVLRLADGELVVAHSNDLGEVSHGAATGSIRERSLAELRDICPELPTLAEALAFFVDEAPEIGVHLDLKQRETADEVAGAIRRFDLAGRTLVSSFSWGGLRRIRQLEPDIRAGVTFPRDPLRIHGRRASGPFVRTAFWNLRAAVPALVRGLLAGAGASTLVLHHQVVSAAAVRRAHGLSAAVVAWTVDDPADLERVDAAGIDAVVSNDPTIFLSTLAP